MRPGVDEHLVRAVRRVGARVGCLAVARDDDLAHGQPVRLGELPVALVMRRHGHDRARAVAHQDVVGDPDRDALAAHRVDDDPSRVDAALGLVLCALLLGEGRGAPHVVEHLLLVLGAGDEARELGVLGREHEERRAVERVGARREDGQVELELGLVEAHLRAVRAADPVPLHREHAIGPVLEQRHVVEQAIGVGRDLEVPLLEGARLDEAAAALAVPVDDLLVREHGLVDRAPLDRRVLLVGEPALVQLQEDPLRPAVVLRLVRRELARPVDRPAHALHLAADGGDVALGHLTRVAALADRGVLGRQAERVVSHRVQHREPGTTPLVAEHVAHRVVLDVPHVQLARRVGKHLEDVRGGRAVCTRVRGVGRLEGALGVPPLLPARLDRLRVVSLHLASSRTVGLGTKKPLLGEAAVRSAVVRRSPGKTERRPPQWLRV